MIKLRLPRRCLWSIGPLVLILVWGGTALAGYRRYVIDKPPSVPNQELAAYLPDRPLCRFSTFGPQRLLWR